MSVLTDEILAYVGKSSEIEFACDAVEQGAIRRYSQAIMDDDPIYWDRNAADGRYDGPVAPQFFPVDLFRRPFGTPDPLQENALDPDFDGIGAPEGQGLPPIEPLRNFSLLNGGSDVEFFRYAKLGDRISVKQRYGAIEEKQSSRGPMVLVKIDAEYRNQDGDLLARVRTTGIWRKPE